MMHIIRLRRPWEKSRDGGSQWIRIDVPEMDEGDVGDDATVLFRRRFNLPSGLQPSSRVRLRVDGWLGHLESITVNDSPLDADSARIDADITDVLQAHNQILVRLRGTTIDPARLSGEVTLAIEDDES